MCEECRLTASAINGWVSSMRHEMWEQETAEEESEECTERSVKSKEQSGVSVRVRSNE